MITDIEILRPAPSLVAPGTVLPAGPAGPGAYEDAVNNGFVGSFADWQASLRSTTPGPSAYERAVALGFVGTETQWLNSLKSDVPGPAGSAESNSSFKLSGAITAPALSADAVDWNPSGFATASTIRISSTAPGIAILGMVADGSGSVKKLQNVGLYTIWLKVAALGTAANRFSLPAAVAIPPGSSYSVQRDDTLSRWVPYAQADDRARQDVFTQSDAARLTTPAQTGTLVDEPGRGIIVVNEDGTIGFRADPATLAAIMSGIQASVDERVSRASRKPAAVLRNRWGQDASVAGLERFLSNDEGAAAPYVRRTDIVSSTALRTDGSTILELMHACGQSNSVDADSDAVTTTPPYRSQVAMLNTGIVGVGAAVLDGNTLTDFVPAYTNTTETCWPGMGAQAAWLLDRFGALRRPILVRSHGLGGTAIAGLNKGTQPYLNGQTEVARIVALAPTYGLAGVRCRVKPWLQGEQDRTLGTSYATYRAALIQLATDHNTDWKAATGQSEDVLTVMTQLGCTTVGTTAAGNASPIALAQLDALALQPLLRIACPGYIFPITIGSSVHRTGLARIVEGEYHANAWYREAIGDPITGAMTPPGHVPLMPASVSRTGAVITVIVNKPPVNFEPVAIGGFTLPKARNFGFEYTDDSSPPAIQSVLIKSTNASNDTVEITLASVPTGSNKLLRYAYSGYAWPAAAGGMPAAWGNLHTRAAVPSRAFPGETRPDFMCVFEAAV